MQICSHLLNKFLTESSFFVYWFVQVTRQKTTLKKKITDFWKNYAASLFTSFEKAFAIRKFFYCLLFRCKVLSPFVFYLLEIQSTVLASSFFAGRRGVYLVIFNKGRKESFAGTFTKLQNLCLDKIFNIDSTTKVNCHEFCFIILKCKMHITPVLLKIIPFIIFFLNRSNFVFVCFFSNNIFSPQKYVYVMFMFTSWHLLEQYN